MKGPYTSIAWFARDTNVYHAYLLCGATTITVEMTRKAVFDKLDVPI